MTDWPPDEAGSPRRWRPREPPALSAGPSLGASDAIKRALEKRAAPRRKSSGAPPRRERRGAARPECEGSGGRAHLIRMLPTVGQRGRADA